MLPDIIRTARLTLRPWAFEDVSDVLAYAQDEEWARYLPVPQPYGERDAKAFIATQILLERDTESTWAIEHEAHAVGGIDVRFYCGQRIAELGYSIARSLWGRGLATEAARAVRDATFDAAPELLRLRAFADSRNAASNRVLEKLGMTREGTLRCNRFVRGEPVDDVWHGILREEWTRAHA